MVVCIHCGAFVDARDDGGRTVPTQAACPDCGDTAFKDTETGQVTTTDPE